MVPSPDALVARLTDSQPLLEVLRSVLPVPPRLRMICAWCPGFENTDPANKGASHGICPTCAARVEADAEDRS